MLFFESAFMLLLSRFKQENKKMYLIGLTVGSLRKMLLPCSKCAVKIRQHYILFTQSYFLLLFVETLKVVKNFKYNTISKSI